MLTSTNNAFEDTFNAGAATTGAAPAVPAASAYTPPVVAPDAQGRPPVAPLAVATPTPTTAAAATDPFHTPAAPKPVAPSVSSPQDGGSIDGPRVLVGFTQDEPCKGKEWRAKTYFVITSNVLVANSQFNPPVVREAPHLAGVDTGVRRNDWDRGSHAVVERRYSELHELRELLAWQFPGLIIPPLPAKKFSQDIETTFNATDAAKLQQYSIELFLTEIARMPDVIFFSFFVSGFFMNARQTFLDVTLPAMQQCLAQFRDRTRPIRQCSVRHRSRSDSALGAVSTTTSWLVRGVASYMSRSSSNNNTNSNNNGSPASGVPTTVVEDDEYQLSALEDPQRRDGEQWLQLVATLHRRQKVLKKSAELYETVLVASNGAAMQGQQVAETLDACKATVAVVKEERTAALCSATVQLFDDVSIADKTLLDGRYLNVRRRLAYERNAMDAVLDAIDHVLSIYAYAVTPASQETAGRKAALIEYAAAVSRDLSSDYKNRWDLWYRVHMRNLCAVQLIAPRLGHVDKVKHLAEQSRLSTTLRTSTEG